MLTLYQFPISHYCEKVRWALAYKNLNYKTVNLLPGLHRRTTQKLATHSSVPILLHNTKAIQNSSDILTYLDQHFTEKLLIPDDIELKQQVLQWENFADDEIGLNLRIFFYHHLFVEPKILIPLLAVNSGWYAPLLIYLMFDKLEEKMRHAMAINKDTAQLAEENLSRAIYKSYEHLQTRPFLVGDSFSRADLTAAALLAPLIKTPKYGINWGQLPEPIEKFINQHREQLAWVEALYTQYR